MSREINANHVCHDNAYGYFCAYSAHCLRRGLYLGRCPRLYTATLTARAACGAIPSHPEVAATIPAMAAKNDRWAFSNGR